MEAEVEERTVIRHQADTGVGYVDFGLIAEKAVRRCGRATWKPAVAFALNMSVKELNAWKTVGVFPAELVARVAALNDCECASSSRQQWADDEIEQLKAILDEGHSDLEAAVILTRKLGRRIYETSITNRRRRLFRDECWRPRAGLKR